MGGVVAVVQMRIIPAVPLPDRVSVGVEFQDSQVSCVDHVEDSVRIHGNGGGVHELAGPGSRGAPFQIEAWRILRRRGHVEGKGHRGAQASQVHHARVHPGRGEAHDLGLYLVGDRFPEGKVEVRDEVVAHKIEVRRVVLRSLDLQRERPPQMFVTGGRGVLGFVGDGDLPLDLDPAGAALGREYRPVVQTGYIKDTTGRNGLHFVAAAGEQEPRKEKAGKKCSDEERLHVDTGYGAQV